MIRAICGATLLLLSTSALAVAAAKTIHVSPAGNDKAEGTADKPLKTLKKALATAASGDTIELAAGAYRGDVQTIVGGVTIAGPADAIVSAPSNRGIEVLHDKT